MKYTRLVASALAVGTTVIAGSALAVPPAPPDVCNSVAGRRGYESGYTLEERWLRSLFEDDYSCGTLEDFIAAVQVDVTPPSSWDVYLSCRDIGLLDAIPETIQAISIECGEQCSDDGESIGELAGSQYCPRMVAMSYCPSCSEEVEFFEPPLPACNLVAQQSCQSSFRRYVQEECAWYAEDDTNFEQKVKDACHLINR